jgi:hypothetical protein
MVADRRDYVEWESPEPKKRNSETEHPFRDPGVRHRFGEWIARAALRPDDRADNENDRRKR